MLIERFTGCTGEPGLPLKDALLSFMVVLKLTLGSEGSNAGILEGREVVAVRKEWMSSF